VEEKADGWVTCFSLDSSFRSFCLFLTYVSLSNVSFRFLTAGDGEGSITFSEHAIISGDPFLVGLHGKKKESEKIKGL
jgi:hypothetical protein